jgi:hypothetical protein
MKTTPIGDVAERKPTIISTSNELFAASDQNSPKLRSLLAKSPADMRGLRAVTALYGCMALRLRTSEKQEIKC